MSVSFCFSYRIVGCLGIFCLFFSCKNYNAKGLAMEGAKGDKGIKNEEIHKKLGPDLKTGILFAHFMIYPLNNEDCLRLKEVQLIENSRIKTDLGLLNEEEPGKLYWVFLDKNQKKIKGTTIENPLVQRVEYSEDGVNMKSKIIEKDSAYFFIRTNYNTTLKWMELYHVDSNRNRRLLKKFDILDLLIENE